MGGYRIARGFSLLETLIALSLVAVAMTGLLVAFVGSGKFGVLARRQANAVAVGRSLANELQFAPWDDVRLVNTNSGNDAAFADPAGHFALPSLPTGAEAPDYTYPDTDPDHPSGSFKVGDETYQVYINVAPDGAEGMLFAVIVRYRVGGDAAGGTYMRAVVVGYRYSPTSVGVRQLPI